MLDVQRSSHYSHFSDVKTMMRENSVMETTNDTVRIVASLRRGEDRGRVGHYNGNLKKHKKKHNSETMRQLRL